jgi:hypothetical protein
MPLACGATPSGPIEKKRKKGEGRVGNSEREEHAFGVQRNPLWANGEEKKKGGGKGREL